jgi:hypothetical protein
VEFAQAVTPAQVQAALASSPQSVATFGTVGATPVANTPYNPYNPNIPYVPGANNTPGGVCTSSNSNWLNSAINGTNAHGTKIDDCIKYPKPASAGEVVQTIILLTAPAQEFFDGMTGELRVSDLIWSPYLNTWVAVHQTNEGKWYGFSVGGSMNDNTSAWYIMIDLLHGVTDPVNHANYTAGSLLTSATNAQAIISAATALVDSGVDKTKADIRSGGINNPDTAVSTASNQIISLLNTTEQSFAAAQLAATQAVNIARNIQQGGTRRFRTSRRKKQTTRATRHKKSRKNKS